MDLALLNSHGKLISNICKIKCGGGTLKMMLAFNEG